MSANLLDPLLACPCTTEQSELLLLRFPERLTRYGKSLSMLGPFSCAELEWADLQPLRVTPNGEPIPENCRYFAIIHPGYSPRTIIGAFNRFLKAHRPTP